jgi:hypothetical protein
LNSAKKILQTYDCLDVLAKVYLSDRSGFRADCHKLHQL